ncbi:hypothetical protein [Prevotella sp.]|uniref:hypothetical protein n=1 Tax=Prevotella sp. TaxID=59823 RepID=UPI003DA587AA
MTNYEKWDQEFRAQNLYTFNNNENALLYLKVRAVCRGKQIKQFTEKNGIVLNSTKINEQFAELFSVMEKIPNGMLMLDTYLRDKNNEWYHTMGVDEDKLKSGLRQINNYEWGGDQENSLDQYLVRRYIKVISDYDELKSKADAIATNAWKFVQTSWYNNWTSYLIESIFKKHRRVLSAVGEIKSVDFFIDNTPVDLKVTYFPVKYMQGRLKEVLGNKEITWLKRKAKSLGIELDKNLSDPEQYKFLKEELENHGHANVIASLTAIRKQIVDDARKNPESLMKWLYENQSPRLFGAENRLFVVVIDSTDMEQSWKMKRAFTLIEPKVKDYLDAFNAQSLKQIDFMFNKKTYKSLADIIFVVKESK